VRLKRGSRAYSRRGHVRVDEGGKWSRWVGVAFAFAAIVSAAALLIMEFVVPLLETRTSAFQNNRTWFEFDPWTVMPDGVQSAQAIAERLRDNRIGTVYLEAAAWLSDGTLQEGEYAAAFARELRAHYPALKVLVWVRMSGEQIADEVMRERALRLAQKAVFEWQFDGVQLNGYAIVNGSESYVQMIRALRETIGSDALLSVTAPPDRIPADPDVPIGLSVAPELTWDVNYKQRIGLLLVDEIVIMAYAAGLEDSAAFETWVAYQLESYAEALSGLESRVKLAVALPTFDAAPGHDPAVETVRAAVRGVEQGRGRMVDSDRFDGVGVYIYSATDSLEWAIYRDAWLGLD